MVSGRTIPILFGRDDVGRVQFAKERTPAVWVWNVQILLPIPRWRNGTAESREQALADFRDAWQKFKAEIDPERYARAIAARKTAAERFK